MADFTKSLTSGLLTGFVDENLTGLNELVPSFLSNNPGDGIKVLTAIQSELEKCTEFYFSVAFLTTDGLATIHSILLDLERQGKVFGKILVSKYQNFTEPEALRKLLRIKSIDLKICEKGNLHSKAYLFRHGNGYNLIIGSSNLTSSALKVNKEWNIRLTSTDNGKLIKQTIKEFKKEFESATVVTERFIEEYTKEYNARNVRLLLEKNSPTRVSPNSMQLDALKGIDKIRRNGGKRALLVSATGTGKTYLSAFDVLAFKPRKFLFIVHRLSIAKKAKSSFEEILGSTKVTGIFSGNLKEKAASYVFSTIQTISKAENYRQFKDDEFEYIVIDETHRSGAKSYKKVLQYFKPKFLLGMTATPERTDGFDIFKQFDHKIAYEIRLKQALEEDMLAPFHYYGVIDISVEGKALKEKSDFKNLVCQERVKHILARMEEYGCDNGIIRGLVFCSKVEEAKVLASEFSKRGYKSECGSGVSEAEREALIERLESDDQEKKLDFIFSVDVFNEGIDIPSVNMVLMLRPTKSAIVFVQQLGRGLRKSDGKKYLTVIDFIGNYSRNYLIPVALFGDNTYEKENLRKLIHIGSRLIPGESTVNFEAIARERIYSSINKANLTTKVDLRNDYNLLRLRLGTDPMMMDFLKHNSRNPFHYALEYGSYFSFLAQNSKDFSGSLSSDAEKCLELLSNEVLNGKRFEEIALFRLLTISAKCSVNELRDFVNNSLGILSTDETIESAIGNSNFEYYVEILNKKRVSARKKFKIHLFETQGDFIVRSSHFDRFLKSNLFESFLSDLIDSAEHVFRDKFKPRLYKGGFQLYERYFRKDVFRLLNWVEAPVELNVGGYKLQKEKKDMAIFVTYHKLKSISKSIQYEEKFLSPEVFEWMSKNSRYLDSPEILALKNEKTMRIPLFIRKSDKEGKEFYYMGDLKAIPDSFEQTEINSDDGKKVPVVKVKFKVTPTVSEAIYSYILNPEGAFE